MPASCLISYPKPASHLDFPEATSTMYILKCVIYFRKKYILLYILEAFKDLKNLNEQNERLFFLINY